MRGRTAAVAARLLAAVLPLSGCASGARSGELSKIAVYQAPPGPGGGPAMPAGCRLVREGAAQSLSEVDLVAPETFRADRARAVQEGANVLLLVETLVAPRSDFDCAATQPISDCPHTLGAWYRVVPRTYACDAEARKALPDFDRLAPAASR